MGMKNRPSPSVSATAFSAGTKKKGNDGSMYVVKLDKNGRSSWKKVGSVAPVMKAKGKATATGLGVAKSATADAKKKAKSMSNSKKSASKPKKSVMKASTKASKVTAKAKAKAKAKASQAKAKSKPAAPAGNGSGSGNGGGSGPPPARPTGAEPWRNSPEKLSAAERAALEDAAKASKINLDSVIKSKAFKDGSTSKTLRHFASVDDDPGSEEDGAPALRMNFFVFLCRADEYGVPGHGTGPSGMIQLPDDIDWEWGQPAKMDALDWHSPGSGGDSIQRQSRM